MNSHIPLERGQIKRKYLNDGTPILRIEFDSANFLSKIKWNRKV